MNIPAQENGSYVYDVDASPKIGLTPQAPAPSEPTDPSLPQTGQPNRPVPVLAALGLCLLLLGFFLRYGKKEAPDAE